MALGMRATMIALGAAGVLPFAAATAGGLTGFAELGFARASLVAYGAVILSFLGAVHWGLALAARERPATGAPENAPALTALEADEAKAGRSRLALGVVPALIGWVALLLPRGLGLLLLIAAFLAVWAAEEIAYRQDLLPGDYLWLRRALTLAVVTCLSASMLTAAQPGE